MTTKSGIIKKTKLEEYSRPRSNGIIAINLKNNDELISVRTSSGDDQILIYLTCDLYILFLPPHSLKYKFHFPNHY